MLFKNFTLFSKQGDSGGPLICGSKEKEKVYGVISWGLDCAKGVGIYSRVAFHRQWIDKEIRKDLCNWGNILDVDDVKVEVLNHYRNSC